MEFPCAVEAFPIVAVFGQHEAGALVVGEGEEPRMGQFLVEGEVFRALPFGAVGLESIGIVKTREDIVGHDSKADAGKAK